MKYRDCGSRGQANYGSSARRWLGAQLALNDRDITVRAVADGSDPLTTSVQSIMSPEVIFCFEDESVEDAVTLMQRRMVRRLVVLTRDGMLAGVVSMSDLMNQQPDKELACAARESIS